MLCNFCLSVFFCNFCTFSMMNGHLLLLYCGVKLEHLVIITQNKDQWCGQWIAAGKKPQKQVISFKIKKRSIRKYTGTEANLKRYARFQRSPSVFCGCGPWWGMLVQVRVQENAVPCQHLGVVPCLLYLLLFSHLSHHTGQVRELRVTIECDTCEDMSHSLPLGNVIISHKNCLKVKRAYNLLGDIIVQKSCFKSCSFTITSSQWLQSFLLKFEEVKLRDWMPKPQL